MSIRHATQPQYPLRGLREGPAAPWVRPSDWLALPWITENEQALVGLIAVCDTDQEKIAFVVGDDYTVDWGDGSAPQNYYANTNAEHTYNYATLGSKKTTRGYKTAIVKITPQAGKLLIRIDLQFKASGTGASVVVAPWLDVQVNAASLATFGTGWSVSYGRQISLNMLERLHIRAHALTTLDNQFNNMQALMSVPDIVGAGITSMAGIASDSPSLYAPPAIDTSNVASASSAYNANKGLRVFPHQHMENLQNASYMIKQCESLYVFDGVTFGSITNAEQMCNGASALRRIGPIDLSSATSLLYAFGGCSSLARSQVVGVKITHSYADCSLSAAALDEIFTNLASGVTGQTITVTGNPGAATCTPSIATAKGWTVVT